MNDQTEPASSALESFGLPERLPRYAAEQLHGTLTELWLMCHRRYPGALRPDLELHRHYFDPVAQGKRLRQALLSISPFTAPGPLAPSQAIPVDSDRLLITPEGRVALELLDVALGEHSDGVRLDGELALRRERDLLTLYRDWGRHRLRSVIDLLGGGEKPLQVPAVAGVLTLLVNRSDSQERAIKRFPPGVARDVIDGVFRSCANAFSQQLAPSIRRASDKERLISGWTLGEITRRMPDALHNSDDQGIYVVASRREELVRFLVAELARRNDVDLQSLEEAFDALVREFKAHAQALAGYALLFERPAETVRLRGLLVSAWEEATRRP
ncbi:MAG: hypothetical protein ACYDHT_04050 [Solirubrobacteraceae bacterium]